MNINPILMYGSQVQGAQETRNLKGEVRKPVPPSSPAGEKVQISDESKSLQQVRDATNNLPDVRSELVALIKAKYDTGSYPVDIAFSKALEKMVQEKILAW